MTKAAFVKLNPKSIKDRQAVMDIAVNWSNCKNNYVSSILAELEYASFSKMPRDFFVLTSQQDDFDNLMPEKILGITQLQQEAPNEMKLKFLQADPKNNEHSLAPKFRGIGKAIVDSIKEYFPYMNITLFSSASAIEFYKKQGFEKLKPNRGQMVFRR